MAKELGLEITADPSLLCAVRGMVRGYVEGFGFPKERVNDVVLAVDEACTNAIRHAYGGPCDRRFRLSITSNNGWIVFQVRDDGTPAPQEAVQQRAPAASSEPPNLDNLVPGGLGIQFIYGVFDSVEFAPGEHEGNCVTMKLKRPDADDESE